MNLVCVISWYVYQFTIATNLKATADSNHVPSSFLSLVDKSRMKWPAVASSSPPPPNYHDHDLELSGSCQSNKSEFLLSQYNTDIRYRSPSIARF